MTSPHRFERSSAPARKARNASIPIALLGILIPLSIARADDLRIASRQGDWTVSGEEIVRDTHIRLDGSLHLPAGTKLTLENCTLEIVGDYSRQHSVEWKGGTLVTRNCNLGGFVNDGGTAIHTVFHLYEGRWDATDTTVSYSYGISFHWEQGKGVLRGERLKAGPRPDAIILSGEADVELVDSDFPIGLGVYCDKGGRTTLDLPPNQTVTRTFDRESLLPGVNWRLKLDNTHVERWFLFLRRIGGWQPAAEITLADSQDLIVSLLGHNLKGEVKLSGGLEKPLTVGNVTLKPPPEKPAGISMYALYFSGNETDVTITGESHICELMHGGGTVRVIGTAGKNEISIGCTTLELTGNAVLEVSHVHMGRPLTWQEENNIGEANVKGMARLIGWDISTKNLRFRTEEQGTVTVNGINPHAVLESQPDGGPIELNGPERDNAVARAEKPMVWILTDMSDKSLPGSNREGTLNDPDDISAMAGYLLMANRFDTRGIVVASTHRKEHRQTPDQADWADRFFGDAYRAESDALNESLGGFPSDISFRQSCIKETAEKYSPERRYESLDRYDSVSALLAVANTLPAGETLNVLCWGSLTEPAILVNHCLATDQADVLKKIRFIAHWTDSPLHQGSADHPERVANCREDAAACRYMKQMARSHKITYHECGAIGQHGIVSGAPKGRAYYDQFKVSRLGTIFAEGKFAHDGVDHSDSATYWSLLGDYGVSLDQIASDGTNSAEIEQLNEQKFRNHSKRLHDELLRRAKAAQTN